MLAIIYRNVPALKALKRGEFQPNSPTFFLWALISLIEVIIILRHHGGFGATSMVFTVVFCTYFGIKGLKTSRENGLDWPFIILMMSGIAGPVILTGLGLMSESVLLVILAVIEALAIIPTFRKIKVSPYSESIAFYVWNDISMLLSCFAASSVTFNTVFVPVIWVIIMTGAIIYILICRKKVPQVEM
ncbi:hypothetical protein H9L19_07215 [Weissella diestrammenae]|uniref:Uncharacterized protein n=2 Tax=Weissella diestrammenae TaxID=1162633 RepID=A0A7G9T7Q5_9LACO|nr:hypothetical protein [Weissella diestrammenae]QNN76130.1 hypothetical protein H9L19_07215 [Weissella diestrammenae]